jgi:hypothetical protein
MALKAVSAPLGSPVGGSGTPGTIPVWSGSGTTLGNSGITDNGSTVTFVSRNLASSAAQTWSLATGTSALNIASGLLNMNTTNSLVSVVDSIASPTCWAFVNGGNSDTIPFVSSLNNATLASATFGWGLFNSNSTGNYGASNGQVFVQNSSGHTRLLQNSTDFYIDGNVSGSAGSIVFRRSSSTLESMRIDSSGNVILNTANTGATIQAAGSQQGLKLPATPGNADTQTLDAYQENGSWTPTLAGFGGTAPTVTSARWTRVGRMVFCELLLNSTGTFSSTAGTTTVSAPATAAVEAAVPTNFSGGNSGVGAQSGSTVYLPTVASSTLARITWQFSV